MVVFPLIAWIIGGIVLLVLAGGFSLFALFNLTKVLGFILVISGIFMIIKSRKKPLLPIILLLVGVFLVLR